MPDIPTVPDHVEHRMKVRIHSLRLDSCIAAEIMGMMRAEFLNGYASGMQVGRVAILLPGSELDEELGGVCA